MRKRTSGFLLALTAALLWGISGTCAQFLFQHRGVSTGWLVTVRLLGAGLLLLARASMTTSLWEIWRRDALPLLIFSLFGVVAVQYTYFAAIHASNVATATVLQYTGPGMIVVTLALRHRKWPTLYEYAALGMAVLGTFLLVTHGSFRSLSISPAALWWGLASAVTMVIYTLQPVGLLERYKASVVIGWAMLVGGICFSCISPPWSVTGQWDTDAVLCLLAIVLLGTLVAFYSYLTAVQWIGAQTTSLLTSAEPVTAAVLAVGWLHVPLALADWAGMGCILLTILLLGKKAFDHG